ncbi:MAG TPA: hypothetical protein VFE62_17010 [Gemmataceae bacterium]|nr:hypothetical protein [Gemmataceae bacterium]
MNRQLSEHQLAQMQHVQWWSLLAGIVALAICVLGAIFDPDQFFRAYLAAYQFYLGLALGSFVVVMIYHLTGGAWGFLIQRILEAAMRTIPYLAVLFIPLAFGLGSLYLWANPDEVAADKELQHKQIYLNVPFFLIRAAIFFALWTAFAWVLDRWSRRQDETGDERYAERQATLSGPGLIVFGISITFAGVDWLMSLQPHFRSTIYGPLIVTGQILSGHAVALIMLAWLAPHPPFTEALKSDAPSEQDGINGVVSPKALNDLGNLLFTFLILWAYMVWFQFMLIWIANFPYEVIWYLPRSRGGWQWVAYTLLVFHFIIPFSLLLSRDLKQHLPTLAKIAGLILATHLAYVYYLVMPSFPDSTILEHWMDFVMPIGIGGLWLWSFLHELKRRPLLARQPEDRAEALHLRKLDEEAARRPLEA